jgi:hypothetical protein
MNVDISLREMMQRVADLTIIIMTGSSHRVLTRRVRTTIERMPGSSRSIKARLPGAVRGDGALPGGEDVPVV